MANISKIRLSGTTYNIVDESAVHSLEGYALEANVQTAITAATDALAQSIAAQGYQTASDVQNAITGKADTTAVTQVASDLSDLSDSVTANTAAIGQLNTNMDTKFGNVVYDSASKRINFYDEANGTVLAYVDATDFIKDGMVSNVEISNGNLVITFNSDAGKQAISIPLTDIFDPSNYYTKTQVDTAIDGVKAYFIDLDAIMSSGGLTDADWDGAIAAVNAHRPVYIKFYNGHFILENYFLDNNNTMYLSASDGISAYQITIIKNGSNDYSLNRVVRSFVSDAQMAAWNAKQDALVSGTNIKTLNGESILGSGNITIEAAGAVDTVMSNTSENAVQNKVIKAYADTKNPLVTIDNETLVIS